MEEDIVRIFKMMCLSFVLGSLCSFVIGVCVDNHEELFQKEAVEHKAGKFVIVDTVSGKTKFYWNDQIHE